MPLDNRSSDHVYREPTELAEPIRKLPSDHRPTVVSIDGFDGSGRTPLSTIVGERLGAKVVHLDDFLNKNRGGYVSELRLPEVKQFIEDELRSGRSLIVEGVCVERVLSLLNVPAGVRIYGPNIETGSTIGNGSSESVGTSGVS